MTTVSERVSNVRQPHRCVTRYVGHIRRKGYEESQVSQIMHKQAVMQSSEAMSCTAAVLSAESATAHVRTGEQRCDGQLAAGTHLYIHGFCIPLVA